MTPDQLGRLRQRFLAVASLRQIYELIEDCSSLLQGEVNALPIFVLKQVLQDLAWRIEGIAVTVELFAKIQQQLFSPIDRVLANMDDPSRCCNELNILAKQYLMLRAELT